MFRQVPVLPVVIPIAAVAFAVLLRSLHRRDRLTVPRAAVALALCVYAAGIVANTVFPIFLDKPAHDGRWSDSLVLTPLVDYELGDSVMNIAVFVPLGILLGLVVSRGSWWRVTAVAAACSLAIEVTQYVTAHLLGGGHVADVNDLLCNVLGGALGAGLLALLGRVPGFGVRSSGSGGGRRCADRAARHRLPGFGFGRKSTGHVSRSGTHSIGSSGRGASSLTPVTPVTCGPGAG